MCSFAKIKGVVKSVCPKLEEKEWNDFENILGCKNLKKGEYFIQPGQNSRIFGFMNAGAVRIFHTDDQGNEITVYFSFENNFCSDLESILLKQPSPVYVEALEDTEMVTINYDQYLAVVDTSKNWERFARILMEGALAHIIYQVHGFMFMSPEERYIRFVKDEAQILEKVPLYHIASYLGIQRESLSRIRKRIAKAEKK